MDERKLAFVIVIALAAQFIWFGREHFGASKRRVK